MKNRQKKYSNKQLKQMFIAFADGTFSQNIKITNTQVIINFCNKYKLDEDEDVLYERFRKTYYRYRKNLELP